MIEKKRTDHIYELVSRFNCLVGLKEEIELAAEALIACYKIGGKVLVCGNGGSAADADHIVGELLKSFEMERPLNRAIKTRLEELSEDRGSHLATNLQQGLPAISLSAHNALFTAISNDISGELIFAQQITGYGTKGDVLIAISSSGNSQNVIDALITAKAKDLITIGFSGQSGGGMKSFCDVLINVPETRIAFVQELHLPIYHALCLEVEQYFFG